MIKFGEHLSLKWRRKCEIAHFTNQSSHLARMVFPVFSLTIYTNQSNINQSILVFGLNGSTYCEGSNVVFEILTHFSWDSQVLFSLILKIIK